MQDPLEGRLRREANQLFKESAPPTADALLALAAGRRIRRRARIGAAGASLIAVALAAYVYWPFAVEAPAVIRNVGRQEVVEEPESRTTRPMTIVVRYGGVERVGVPFVVRQVNDQGEEEFVTGVYIPESSEPLDWGSLSPWERNAAERLLDSRAEADAT